VLKQSILSEFSVESAGWIPSRGGSKDLVLFLTRDGREIFFQATASNRNREMAIVWRGEVIATVQFEEPIYTRIRIPIRVEMDDADTGALMDVLNHRARSSPETVQQAAPSPPTNAPPAQDDTVRDLLARYEAAKSITAFTQRDSELTVVAGHAARAGQFELTRRALNDITAFTTRDAAVREAARSFVQMGRRADALQLSRLMTSMTERDALLREVSD
jgi:hypothetical protein